MDVDRQQGTVQLSKDLQVATETGKEKYEVANRLALFFCSWQTM